MYEIQKIVFIACIMAVIISIFNILYPGKKFTRQVRMIFSAIFILSIAVPIINADFEFESFDTYIQNDSYISVNENVQNAFKQTAEENISDALEEKILLHGMNVEKIETSINISEDNSISISEVRIISKNPSNELYNLIRNEVETDTEINIFKIQE